MADDTNGTVVPPLAPGTNAHASTSVSSSGPSSSLLPVGFALSFGSFSSSSSVTAAWSSVAAAAQMTTPARSSTNASALHEASLTSKLCSSCELTIPPVRARAPPLPTAVVRACPPEQVRLLVALLRATHPRLGITRAAVRAIARLANRLAHHLIAHAAGAADNATTGADRIAFVFPPSVDVEEVSKHLALKRARALEQHAVGKYAFFASTIVDRWLAEHAQMTTDACMAASSSTPPPPLVLSSVERASLQITVNYACQEVLRASLAVCGESNSLAVRCFDVHRALLVDAEFDALTGFLGAPFASRDIHDDGRDDDDIDTRCHARASSSTLMSPPADPARHSPLPVHSAFGHVLAETFASNVPALRAANAREWYFDPVKVKRYAQQYAEGRLPSGDAHFYRRHRIRPIAFYGCRRYPFRGETGPANDPILPPRVNRQMICRVFSFELLDSRDRAWPFVVELCGADARTIDPDGWIRSEADGVTVGFVDRAAEHEDEAGRIRCLDNTPRSMQLIRHFHEDGERRRRQRRQGRANDDDHDDEQEHKTLPTLKEYDPAAASSAPRMAAPIKSRKRRLDAFLDDMLAEKEDEDDDDDDDEEDEEDDEDETADFVFGHHSDRHQISDETMRHDGEMLPDQALASDTGSTEHLPSDEPPSKRQRLPSSATDEESKSSVDLASFVPFDEEEQKSQSLTSASAASSSTSPPAAAAASYTAATLAPTSSIGAASSGTAQTATASPPPSRLSRRAPIEADITFAAVQSNAAVECAHAASRVRALLARLREARASARSQAARVHLETRWRACLPLALFERHSHAPQLFHANHPPAVRAAFTAAAVDLAMRQAGLKPLPQVLLQLIGEFEPAVLPFIDEPLSAAEQATRAEELRAITQKLVEDDDVRREEDEAADDAGERATAEAMNDAEAAM